MLAPVFGAQAQGTRTTRVMEFRKPMDGACASFTSAPSELMRTPEGQTLLRYRRELEGVATIIEQRGSIVGESDARRLFEIQRGVDSLMTVFVRNRTADGSTGSSITVLRGDSNMVLMGRLMPGLVPSESMESAIKAMRPNIDVTLRALEPHSTAATGARAVNRASPTGYLGVNLSGSQIRMVTDSGTFTAHCDYPMIESVDVGSPARKADLRAGDTVIAYNGRDVVALTVNYPQLLVPGKTIKVRVRRDGKSRELPVNVGERPVEFTDQTLRFVPGTMRTGPTARLGASGGNVFFERVAPMPPSGAATVVASAMSLMVMQGAQLTVVEDEFAQTQNMEPGILVLRVQPGTPAAEAGLRAGEMIRALNGTPVRELLPIKRMLGTPGIREVKLTVSGRETPVRILTLRW
jgi:hypothetical protein